MEIITCWSTLIKKAKKLGQARLKGDEKEIREAEKELKEYEQLCLESDKLII